MTCLNLITVSGDPGGAKVVALVAQYLQQHRLCRLRHYGYNEAVRVLAAHGLEPCYELLEHNLKGILNALANQSVNCIILGTSVNTKNWEQRFIERAQQLGIMTISVLDFWSNYTARFSHGFIPSRIAVMDHTAKTAMIAVGFAAEKIWVTGHPVLDNLPVKKPVMNRPSQQNVIKILFVSQPLSVMNTHPEGQGDLGFDEFSVFDELISILAAIQQNCPKQIQLHVRLHPREARDKFNGLLRGASVQCILDDSACSYDALVGMDLIVGMNSMLLLEAYYLGYPVLSLQPGLRIANDWPAECETQLNCVYDSAMIPAVLSQLLLASTSANRPSKSPAAIFTAAEIISKYLYWTVTMEKPFPNLAIFGGPKALDRELKPYNAFDDKEVQAAKAVLDSGVLSQFIGAAGQHFMGGPNVIAFEAACKAYFNVKHAITVNSWTSGLIACVGALDIEPGDEIIVSPWTMCASATAILHWNAIPVFADIDPETFCLDPISVAANISSRTKAIMAIDIFGQSADMTALQAIADRHNLQIISDTAQAPGALVGERYAGTIGDVGGFSLNYHKHIHTGEGGIVVTNDDAIAKRVCLIRNHAEAVVGDEEGVALDNMLGYNFRLGEIECAIGIEQLKKLDTIIQDKQALAQQLTAGLKDLTGLQTPVIRAGNTHVYYVYPLVLAPDFTISRERLVAALRAEGVPGLIAGYQNIHLLPLYQQKIAYGKQHFPWHQAICSREVSYAKGICPVAEDLHDARFIGISFCAFDYTRADIADIVTAFKKVWANLEMLAPDPTIKTLCYT